MADQRGGEPAPILPGFDVERVLSTGEHVDEYLCRSQLPRPRVVVQVARGTVDAARSRAHVASAAKVLAALSAHPSIVTVHDVGVTADGHPYLVVEHCSLPSPADRSRHRPLDLPEVLQTIVRVAGAVETAHSAGVLHGEITPAKLLTTDDDRPALADIGLSWLFPSPDPGAASRPWAPPEALLGHPVDPRADVYSLAATAYTLLAGHPPFSDAPTDAATLAARIAMGDPRPISRADLPESVERLLRRAMSADPRDRPQTASDFARSLQRIEQDMRLPVTRLDILPIAPITEDDPADTVLSSPRSAPDDATVLGSRRPSPRPDDATVLGSRRIADDATHVAPRRADPIADDGATRLSARGAPEADDRTRLVSRGDALGNAIDDALDDADVEGVQRPVTARVAYTPAAVADAYGVRGQQPRPEIVRSPVLPPAAVSTPVPPARRRRRGRGIIVACAVGVMVFGGAIGGIVALLMGSWGE